MGEDRKTVWVDPFQTRLSLRIGGYLAVFFVVFCNLLFVWKLCTEGVTDPVGQFLETLRANVPVLVCLIFLVPVMAWDMIRFSHHLVGPLVRFRHAIKAIADGEPIRPVKLRDGDHLTEMRDEFNRMLEELQKRGVPVLKPADPARENGESEKKSA
ncbi:MAG: hypothetical protein HYX68_15955 [Planctomycetes bacterium]|nr:hypothetical protein [Planctomycetota bacterium]